MEKIEIHTRDGICPAWVHRPSGAGPWPAVLMFMDGPGIRPAVQEMAARLAGGGFFVLLPDLFYRSGAYAPVDPRTLFADPALLAAHREKYFAPAPAAKIMSDTAAFLEYLAAAPGVRPGPVGITGYCMGGRLALVAAGTFPDRIAVAASFHGGGLATDAPDSPHLLAPRMKAKIFVAGAIEDANFTDAMKARLEAALTGAGVDHKVETWPARHGWVPRDTPAYDPAEAEHHWCTLVPLMDRVLRG
ncbi:MAG TPA: dienelactone hydrolase family protein [Allosphingosinicella sp.]